MDRKTFIQKTVGAMFIAIPAYSLVGCSSSDNGLSDLNPNPNPNPQANCVENGTTGLIASNHGHTLTVSSADVEAGAEKTYSIQGTSGHNHTVTLTASDFTSLQGNNAVELNSTTGDGHTHAIVVSCA